MMLEAFVGGGPEAPTWVIASMVEAMVPLMERFGIATSDEVDPDTLATRMLMELIEHDGVMITPLLVGAWTTVCL